MLAMTPGEEANVAKFRRQARAASPSLGTHQPKKVGETALFRTTILRRVARLAALFPVSRASIMSSPLLQVAVFLGAMLACSSAMASGYIMGGHKITNITTSGGGDGIYITTQGPLPAGADCGAGNNFMLENNQPMQREIFSMLLIAFQNKIPVTIYVDGCYNTSMKFKSVGFAAS